MKPFLAWAVMLPHATQPIVCSSRARARVYGCQLKPRPRVVKVRVEEVRTAPSRKPRLVWPHNPDALTDEQVGVAAGWRLLERDEIRERPDSHSLQAWSGTAWTESMRMAGSSLGITYRTALSRAALAKLT